MALGALGEGVRRIIHPRAGEGALQSWWTVAAWGALGAFIDFYIGKAGQRRVRDWLETWWLRLNDVRWRNLGREEALFALRTMDRWFGKRLFSPRRVIVVVVFTLIAGSFLLVSLKLGHFELFSWRDLNRPNTYLHFAFVFIAFGMSFSITRLVTSIVSSTLGYAPYISLLGIVVLCFFQYLLLCYWSPAINYELVHLSWAYNLIAPPSVFLLAMFMVDLRNIILYGFYLISHLQIVSASAELKDISRLFHINFEDGVTSNFVYHLSALLNLVPNLTRLMLAVVFTASFFLKPLQRPIMTLWARIIESDTPVFTLLFGGSATVVKAIREIVMLIHS